jgi:ankyrin repeat protein
LADRFARLFLTSLAVAFSAAWAGPNEDLLLSAQKGDVAGVAAALGADADINARGRDGWTALETAVANRGRVELTKTRDIVKLLIAKGAGVNTKDSGGWTPLLRTGDAQVAKLLIAAGADVNASRDTRTVLMNAAEENNVEIVRLLLDAGADVRPRDHRGLNAMSLAASRGHAEVVRLLLGKGSDANERFESDVTALMLAARDGHVETVKLLIAHGADVNAKSKNGVTALREATSNGYGDVAEILKAAGAK